MNEASTTIHKTIYTQGDDISPRELVIKVVGWIKYLKSNWLLIILASLIGGGIGFVYAYSEKTLYTATLTFALEEDKSSGGGFSGLASQFGFDIGSGAGGAFSGGNLYELMKSRTLVAKTLLEPVIVNNRKMSFADLYIQMNELKKKDSNLEKINFIAGTAIKNLSIEQSQILESISGTVISKMLNIAQKDRKTSITSVEVTSKNEIFSKAFSEALVKEVSSFYIETKSKKAKINVAILEKQIDSIRNELNTSISQVATVNDNTYNLNPAFNIKRVPSTQRQIDVQANSAMLAQFVQSLVLARISLQKETPLIQIIDLPSLPLKETKVNNLMSIFVGIFLGLLISSVLLLGFRFARTVFNTYAAAINE